MDNIEFNIGDKVIVKENLRDIPCFQSGYMPEMDRFEGKIVTIKDFVCDKKGVIIEEDEKKYTWDIRAFKRINIERNEIEFGDILTLRNGERYVVARGVMFGEKGFYNRDADGVEVWYYNDLTQNENNKNEDIIRVERAGNIIYERQTEAKKMTVAQICKELGYDIEIVKEEK